MNTTNRSPYGIAEAAAIAAAFAQVHPSARAAYIRRRAYRATRAAWPALTAASAYALARSAQSAAIRFHNLSRSLAAAH
jgi:hypothetical protein